jgi:methyltransferase
MRLVTRIYLALLGSAGSLHLLELLISKRHQQALAASGAERAADPAFRAIVWLHLFVFGGSALEVVLLRRRFHPWLAGLMAPPFLAASLLRWWVIRTLGLHWNVRVVNSLAGGVVSAGPYRWIRHPNYVAVFLELLSIPLLHSAWLTATLAGFGSLLVLHRRIQSEEQILLSDERYLAVMGSKPRFLPRWNRR